VNIDVARALLADQAQGAEMPPERREALEAVLAELSRLDRYYPGLADSCRRAYHLTIDAIRDAAKAKGYAIGVHGSLSRDIDLIACPWTDGAAPPEELAEAVRRAAAGAIPGGNCWAKQGDPKPKPHGRQAWSFYFAAGGYIDLSIMPRATSATDEPPERMALLDGLTGEARVEAAHNAAIDCGRPSCSWCRPEKGAAK
jgi:hypothetical protein